MEPDAAPRGEPITVVSGLPRSGTSMMMSMLVAGGMSAVTDDARSPDEDNPRGYFEDRRVKAMTKNPDRTWLAETRGKAIKIVSRLLPELPPIYDYSIVFMRRDIREILASQDKMLARRGGTPSVPDERMQALFERDLERTRVLLQTATHFKAIDVDYGAVLASPLGEALRISAFLERDLDIDRMVAVVDAALYRNRVES